MAQRFESFYRFSDGSGGTLLNASTFNRIFRDLDARIAALENVENGIDSILTQLRDRGATQINDGILPILDQLGSLGADEVAAAQAILSVMQGYETQALSALTDIQNGTFTGDLNIGGNLSAAGNLSATNLTGSNTGDHGNATSSVSGLVRIEAGATNINVFTQNKVNALIAAATSNVTTNTGNIAANAGNIAANAGGVATNAGNISTNAGDITALDSRITALENAGGGGGGGGGGVDILYVVANPDVGDNDRITELQTAGFTVTTILETATDIDTQAANYDVLVVGGDSSAYGSSHLDELISIATPIVIADHEVVENLALGNTPITISIDAIQVSLSSHPIPTQAGNFNGYVQVLNSFTSCIKWKLAAGADDIAPDGAKSLLWVYETGTATHNGNAAARRVGFGYPQRNLSQDGSDLFLEAVNWARGAI